MLDLTEQARELIEELCAGHSSSGAGLRIARRPAGLGLTMSLADEPEPGDVVLRVEDAVLFLDGTARRRLAGQTLGARRNEQGAAFYL